MSKGSILIVEDELWIAKDIKDCLLADNFEVCDTCISVDEALESLKVKRPDLVFIDIKLSGRRTGIELGQILREKELIPFAYLTSYADQLILEKAKETRPDGYIVKPFRSVDITTTTEIIINNTHDSDLERGEGIQLPDTSNIPFRIRKTTNFIHENVEKKMLTTELAVLSGWKEQHFISNFKKHLGITPYQYVLMVKIKKAQALLKETSSPVVQIAHELGFLSHSNFSINFRKLTGMTAQEYRNQNGSFY